MTGHNKGGKKDSSKNHKKDPKKKTTKESLPSTSGATTMDMTNTARVEIGKDLEKAVDQLNRVKLYGQEDEVLKTAVNPAETMKSLDMIVHFKLDVLNLQDLFRELPGERLDKMEDNDIAKLAKSLSVFRIRDSEEKRAIVQELFSAESFSDFLTRLDNRLKLQQDIKLRASLSSKSSKSLSTLSLSSGKGLASPLLKKSQSADQKENIPKNDEKKLKELKEDAPSKVVVESSTESKEISGKSSESSQSSSETTSSQESLTVKKTGNDSIEKAAEINKYVKELAEKTGMVNEELKSNLDEPKIESPELPTDPMNPQEVPTEEINFLLTPEEKAEETEASKKLLEDLHNLASTSGLNKVDLLPKKMALNFPNIDEYVDAEAGVDDIVNSPTSEKAFQHDQEIRKYILSLLVPSGQRILEWYSAPSTIAKMAEENSTAISRFNLHKDRLTIDCSVLSTLDSRLKQEMVDHVEGEYSIEIPKFVIIQVIKGLLAIADYLRSADIHPDELLAIHYVIIKLVHPICPFIAEGINIPGLSFAEESCNLAKSFIVATLQAKSILRLAGYATVLKIYSGIQVQILARVAVIQAGHIGNLSQKLTQSVNATQTFIGQVFHLVSQFCMNFTSLFKTVSSIKEKEALQKAKDLSSSTVSIPGHLKGEDKLGSRHKLRAESTTSIHKAHRATLKVGGFLGHTISIDPDNRGLWSRSGQAVIKQHWNKTLPVMLSDQLAGMSGDLIDQLGHFNHRKSFGEVLSILEQADFGVANGEKLFRKEFNLFLKARSSELNIDMASMFNKEWKTLLIDEWIKRLTEH